jgi:AcrR family transcriptional regulator
MAIEDEPGADSRWRERAVERSLRSARARALSRSDRFIKAATELVHETGRIDFTVQEVVERSKMSLRSFYQHFASKDELLLALFEETVRDTMSRLRTYVDKFTDPVDRLRAFVVGLYGTGERDDDPASRALTIFHLQLAESHPTELAQALAPQIDFLAEIVQAGVKSGQLRQDIEPQALVMILMQSLVAALQMQVLEIHMTGVAVTAKQLWAFYWGAVTAPTNAAAPRSGRTAKQASTR